MEKVFVSFAKEELIKFIRKIYFENKKILSWHNLLNLIERTDKFGG